MGEVRKTKIAFEIIWPLDSRLSEISSKYLSIFNNFHRIFFFNFIKFLQNIDVPNNLMKMQKFIVMKATWKRISSNSGVYLLTQQIFYKWSQKILVIQDVARSPFNPFFLLFVWGIWYLSVKNCGRIYVGCHNVVIFSDGAYHCSKLVPTLLWSKVIFFFPLKGF